MMHPLSPVCMNAQTSNPLAVSASNPWFAISMGLLGIIVGYALASGLQGGLVRQPSAGAPTVDTTPPPPPPAANDTPATPDDDPVLGQADAPITLIEFTDYQCPFCNRHFTQTYGQIKKDYVDTGKVKLVVRDFPLSFHPNAQKAAESAECAGKQDKYYAMHDLLFSKQGEWSNLSPAVDQFKQYAADLKLATAQFNKCLDSGETAAEISKDTTDGSTSGIDGTPGFWILGPKGKTQKISGAFPYDTFKAAFDAMLGG